MTDWTQGYVSANGLEVFYRRTGAGSGKPPLLLLHGYVDSGQCWTAVARTLEDTFDLIMPDARGHGRTRGPINDMLLDILAADAAAVIQALGLGKVFLFGHSMGGMTALAVAANYPGLIHAAVLEDPPFMLPNPYIVTEEMAAQFRADVRDTLALHDLPLADRIARCRAEQPHWPDEEVLPWAESKGEFDPEILQQRTRFRAYPWRDALSRVSCPLLLITADVVEGALIIPELADEAAQRCPTCEVAHIAGAGHSIHRDRSVEMLRRVRSFFGRLMPA